MMLGWIVQGLRTGIVTSRYPRRLDPPTSGVRNRLVLNPERCHPAEHGECAAVCPTAALRLGGRRLTLDLGLCIQCGLCVDACPPEALGFTGDYEVAVRDRADLVTMVVDR